MTTLQEYQQQLATLPQQSDAISPPALLAAGLVASIGTVFGLIGIWCIDSVAQEKLGDVCCMAARLANAAEVTLEKPDSILWSKCPDDELMYLMMQHGLKAHASIHLAGGTIHKTNLTDGLAGCFNAVYELSRHRPFSFEDVLDANIAKVVSGSGHGRGE